MPLTVFTDPTANASIAGGRLLRVFRATSQLAPNERLVLLAVAAGDRHLIHGRTVYGIAPEAVAKATGFATSTVKRTLTALTARGYVKRVAPGIVELSLDERDLGAGAHLRDTDRTPTRQEPTR